jgi:hypothetical protein
MIFSSFSGPLLQAYAQDGKRQRLGVAQGLLGLLLSLRSVLTCRNANQKYLILFVAYPVERVEKGIRWGAAALAW